MNYYLILPYLRPWIKLWIRKYLSDCNSDCNYKTRIPIHGVYTSLHMSLMGTALRQGVISMNLV